MKRGIKLLNTRRSFIKILAIGLAVVTLSTTFLFAENPRMPNVIYVLVDDLGFGDIGCYGQDTLRTPNIDRMAEEGMRFTRNYSGSTVCAPSRCVLLTGKHTGNSTIRGNSVQLLKKEDFTVADLFKKAGYVTGNFGKWGIGHPPPPDTPNQHGFDEFFGYVNMYHAHNFYPEFLIHNGKEIKLRNELMEEFKDKQTRKFRGFGVSKEKIDYAPDIIRRRMFEFIDKNHKQPFFLLYTPNTPHANNEGEPYDRGMEVPDFGDYAKEKWPKAEKGFAKMIHDLDNDIGKLMAVLKKYDIEKNTLLIFSSDNGPHQEGGHQMGFFNSNGEKRGMKRDLFEGGVRVPMIARWPGKIPAGKVNNSIVAFQDLMATCAELTKTSCPKTDGISMMPALLGQKTEDISRTLFWEFQKKDRKEELVEAKQSILMGNWKLIRYYDLKKPSMDDLEKPYMELYNVKSDPTEAKNLIVQQPQRAKSMLRVMESIPDENSVFK